MNICFLDTVENNYIATHLHTPHVLKSGSEGNNGLSQQAGNACSRTSMQSKFLARCGCEKSTQASRATEPSIPVRCEELEQPIGRMQARQNQQAKKRQRQRQRRLGKSNHSGTPGLKFQDCKQACKLGCKPTCGHLCAAGGGGWLLHQQGDSHIANWVAHGHNLRMCAWDGCYRATCCTRRVTVTFLTGLQPAHAHMGRLLGGRLLNHEQTINRQIMDPVHIGAGTAPEAKEKTGAKGAWVRNEQAALDAMLNSSSPMTQHTNANMQSSSPCCLPPRPLGPAG